MSHDDFDQEPINGLPELPPEGEVILWQGRPDWWALTKESLNLYWVVGYFLFLFAWRFIVLSDQVTLSQAVSGAFPFIVLGGIVSVLLMITAIIQARATVYTITNRRVAMRIGAALTVTLNLPYTQIANATLDLRKTGTGTIALDAAHPTRAALHPRGGQYCQDDQRRGGKACHKPGHHPQSPCRCTAGQCCCGRMRIRS